MLKFGVIEELRPTCLKTRKSNPAHVDRFEQYDTDIGRLASFRAAIKEGCDAIESGESITSSPALVAGRC